MYDPEGARGTDAERWAMLKILDLTAKYLSAKEFWQYVEEQWLFKAHMWVVGYRELPYTGQDTNAAIEGYQSTLKATLKAAKCRMLGRRVDRLVHELTGEVLTHFWYQNLRKHFGFVINKRQEQIVIQTLLKARNIPDSNVALRIEEGAPAMLCSCTKPNVVYTVFNPTSEWAFCTCSQANRGYICKHKLKVFRMLRPNVQEGSIARLCGSLQGTVHGGVHKIFSSDNPDAVPATPTSEDQRRDDRGPRLENRVHGDDVEQEVWNTVSSMITEAQEKEVLLRHLLAGVLHLKGSQSRLVVDMECGILHPSQSAPYFESVQDDNTYSLKKRRDFLERGVGAYFRSDQGNTERQ